MNNHSVTTHTGTVSAKNVLEMAINHPGVLRMESDSGDEMRVVVEVVEWQIDPKLGDGYSVTGMYGNKDFKCFVRSAAISGHLDESIQVDYELS